MRFHVISKCIDQQDGDILIDLEDMTLKKIDLNESVEEDKTYVKANEQIIIIHNLNWGIKDSYLEAFSKTRKLKKQEFKFFKIKGPSNIYIDKNNFIFNDDSLVGRLVNKGEIDNLENMGIDRFNELLNKTSKQEIVFLLRGKKIYRIFTSVKLNILLNDENSQINMYQYLNKDQSNEILEKLKVDISVAHNKLYNALKYIDEELGK